MLVIAGRDHAAWDLDCVPDVAWRAAGAPLLRGEPASPEFMASYNEAIESRRLAGKIPGAGDALQGEQRL